MKRTIIMLLTAILLPIAANAQEKHEFSKSGYGAHAGIKHSTYTSAFGYYFTPFTMITAGLDLTWGKASLGLDYSLGKGKIRYDSSILMGIAKKGNADGPSYKEDVYIRHHKGDPYFPSDIMITLGYALLDNEHIKLGPMIGFGFDSIRDAVKNKDRSWNMQGGQLAAGLTVGWKFHRMVTTPENESKRKHIENLLKAKFFFASNTYPNWSMKISDGKRQEKVITGEIPNQRSITFNIAITADILFNTLKQK